MYMDTVYKPQAIRAEAFKKKTLYPEFFLDVAVDNF